jgi:hypothetical protein
MRFLPECRDEHAEDNFWVGDQVAPGEARGLLLEPVQPFQAVTAHPGRRAGGDAGAELQCGADAQADAGTIAARPDRIGEKFLHRGA